MMHHESPLHQTQITKEGKEAGNEQKRRKRKKKKKRRERKDTRVLLSAVLATILGMRPES